MHEFTLIDPMKLGEDDPQYGQKWWSKVHESQMPVSFNLKGQDVTNGQKITCEEYSVRKSAKGTDYQQLRKVKTGVSSAQPKLGGTTARQFKADPDKQAEIRAEWALGKAAEIIGLDDMDKVFAKAQALHGMVDRLKAGEQEVKEQAQLNEPFGAYPEDAGVGAGKPVPDEVHEVDESQPISLEDVPF